MYLHVATLAKINQIAYGIVHRIAVFVMNMKISIITPTIRTERLKIVAEALQSQTFPKENIEWIICSPSEKEMEIEKSINNIFPYIFLGNPPLKKGQFWDLNFSYNRLIKESKGELIVTLQDSIWVTPTGLQQFWDAHQEYPEAIITGVGDQYERIGDFGKPEVKIWADPRKRQDLGSFYEINWNDAEFNWCAIPRKAFYDVGGFDEQLDFLGVGGDQFQLCERLNEMGMRFWIDQSNESFTLRHDRSAHGGEKQWNKNHVLFNGEYEKVKEELKEKGLWPKLDYLI